MPWPPQPVLRKIVATVSSWLYGNITISFQEVKSSFANGSQRCLHSILAIICIALYPALATASRIASAASVLVVGRASNRMFVPTRTSFRQGRSDSGVLIPSGSSGSVGLVRRSMGRCIRFAPRPRPGVSDCESSPSAHSLLEASIQQQMPRKQRRTRKGSHAQC